MLRGAEKEDLVVVLVEMGETVDPEARQKTENETRIREARHKEMDTKLKAKEETRLKLGTRPDSRLGIRSDSSLGSRSRLKAREEARLKAGKKEAKAMEER
ncbi:hypothetical protein TNIN_290471 [Trichonephila inaurata madagascariensis]|uniref:Uncharacterized protein n=1 Tax=Trichonephila inaurata madagascariensis TaxID=2747483 RepID=A0A8X7BTX0_9ARAC|nr:hypothetical protein TNIN_290471 [Trichonephila inaurata madagascariensis]